MYSTGYWSKGQLTASGHPTHRRLPRQLIPTQEPPSAASGTSLNTKRLDEDTEVLSWAQMAICGMHSCQAKLLSTSMKSSLRRCTSDTAAALHPPVGQATWRATSNCMEMNKRDQWEKMKTSVSVQRKKIIYAGSFFLFSFWLCKQSWICIRIYLVVRELLLSFMLAVGGS